MPGVLFVPDADNKKIPTKRKARKSPKASNIFDDNKIRISVADAQGTVIDCTEIDLAAVARVIKSIGKKHGAVRAARVCLDAENLIIEQVRETVAHEIAAALRRLGAKK